MQVELKESRFSLFWRFGGYGVHSDSAACGQRGLRAPKSRRPLSPRKAEAKPGAGRWDLHAIALITRPTGQSRTLVCVASA